MREEVKKTKGKNKQTTPLQRYLLYELYKRSFSVTEAHNYMMENFQCYLSKNYIASKLNKDFRNPDPLFSNPVDPKHKRAQAEAEDMVKFVDGRLRKKLNNEISKAIDMGSQIDNLLAKRLNNETLSDASLTKLSKDMFERQRLLEEKPTSISGKEKLSDKEIYDKITTLKKKGRILDIGESNGGTDTGNGSGGKGASAGVTEKEGTGTDKVLGATHEAEAS